MIQQVPGVQMDRINVGGNQSGQQSAFIGMGTDASQNSFNMDGVTITDMAALGSSPTYYDFDQFQEVQVATGGTDPALAVPGVTLNMVTKRGTNDVHGSGRYFITPGQWQARNLGEEARAQGNSELTNSTVCITGCKGGGAGIQDYGVEAGGPIWPDHAWLWGSYGRKEIPLRQLGCLGTADCANSTLAGASPADTTYLDDYAGKLNIQPIESNSATVFYFWGGKSKLGRSAGPTRPAETSVDQSGPTTIWKGEDSQVFGPNFVASAAYSYIAGGFGLIPEGGQLPPTIGVYQTATGVYHRSYQFYKTNRPQHQADANLSSFFSTGSIGHELKFGFGWRNALIQSTQFWPGSQVVGLETQRPHPGVCDSCGTAVITRPANFGLQYTYYDGFIGDTMTIGSNLTLNVGVRYDHQYGNNQPSVIASNTMFPNLVPGVAYPGASSEFTWNNWEPRVGLTYALGQQKTTLLRASYAQFADQLGGSVVSWDNPAGGAGNGGSRYGWTDTNGNNNVDPGELLGYISSFGGFDPSCPTCLSSSNTVVSDLKAPRTYEIQAGVDQQVLPELVAGFTYTYRKRNHIVWSPWTGVTAADYAGPLAPPEQGFDYQGRLLGTTDPIFGTNPLNPAFNFGQTVSNRPDYDQNYNGFTLQMTKRLTDRWMAHAAVTWQSWKQSIGNKATACIDPTNQLYPTDGFFVAQPVGPTCSNTYLYQESVGSGNFGNVWIGSKWNFNFSALYQLPWNFNIAANVFGRQGYVNPYYAEVDTGNGEGTRLVLIGNPQNFRLNTLMELDLRVEKVIPLFQKADLTLSADVFNATNANTVLQRESDTSTGVAGQIYEVQPGRVVRLGARLSF
jgi:outer membrane receptor protein involved in Fe transport